MNTLYPSHSDKHLAFASRSCRFAAMLAFGLLLFFPLQSFAAFDIVLKLEGPDVKGESMVAGHEEEIDVLSVQEGMTQSGSFHAGGGGGAGKVNIQDVTITKYLDLSSVELRRAAASGSHFSNATITLIKSGADRHVFFVIKLDKVLISSVSMGTSVGEDRPTETVTLNTGKMSWEYIPQKPDGSSGAPIKGCWDIETNGEC